MEEEQDRMESVIEEVMDKATQKQAINYLWLNCLLNLAGLFLLGIIFSIVAFELPIIQLIICLAWVFLFAVGYWKLNKVWKPQ